MTSMLAGITFDVWLDGWIIAIAILASCSAALLGNFLLLRRMSLLSDAISHSVLPGLAAGYLITGNRQSWTALLGAIIVGLIMVYITEFIGQIGKVDEGASTGIVFTGLFAIGLIMIVQAADKVDLDPNCVLYGDIELSPLDSISTSLGDIPRSAIVMSVCFLINLASVIIAFRPLTLSTFDPSLSKSFGWSPRATHYYLATLVAVTSVCSFEAVGNVLVVTMFIVPATISFLFTRRLPPMILVSLLVAFLSATLGHILAVSAPSWFGYKSTSTAAMISVVAGMLLVFSLLFSPQAGAFVKAYRRRKIAWDILRQDVLALLFRDFERGVTGRSSAEIGKKIIASPWKTSSALRNLINQGSIEKRHTGDKSQVSSNHGGNDANEFIFALTDQGKKSAQNLIRSHRLWEQYLATNAGVTSDRLHVQAETFEHYTGPSLRDLLDTATEKATSDPHGKSIPPEQRL